MLSPQNQRDGVHLADGRSDRGRFTRRSKVSLALSFRAMNVDEEKKFRAALKMFLSEIVRRELGRKEDK
ncbi:MAG: hypothetical protein ACAI43_13055 [Phycisphaerae bacterium]